ncbi:SDR family oxidoreductase [Arthrobacter sp. I2-34]|uniref:SDR family oxidoreductase n=1 Tax=Arthrobacter hankyongi TaxID=2904801 RepID=A0ABS9L7F8_9MICC|nr:SDR family NAD(P)-dependent oxidoreductase [Arthrobacter hankyongi]MCG2622602.1 SDR family oxidoreductase [Arthrobacter hankyongi]
MSLLENQTILITGGAAGQGRAHALASAREGADVVVLDVYDEDAPQFIETVRGVEELGRKALAVRADVTSQTALDDAVARGIETFGKIDAAIINAGIHRAGLFWEMEEKDWDAVMAVNLTGAWKTAKAVAPHMIGRQSGSIVLVSSVDAFDPEVDSTAYGVSKTALLGLLKYTANELAPHNVRVNAVAPGFIDTAMVNSQEFYDLLAGEPGKGTRQHLIDYGHQFTAMKGVSMMQPVEVANTVVYLNSPLARYVTGVTIPVDAGHLLVSRINQNPAY